MERKVRSVNRGYVLPQSGMPFKRYRKKPVVIEAFQVNEMFDIETLEGTMRANSGDWIIRGVKGELYPCKPDIFEQTYELA